MINALIYPAILMTMVGFSLLFLLGYVVPQFSAMYENLDTLHAAHNAAKAIARDNAIKGMPGARPVWNHRAGKSQKYRAQVWHVGSDTAKDAWYSRLRTKEEGPGYCHFPLEFTERFFEQLTAEQVRTKYSKGRPIREWFLPSGKRNEALDCYVYGLAALHSRPVDWHQLAAQTGAMTAPRAAPRADTRSRAGRSNEWGL